ncbi:MAG: NYN domain-containing protein [Candidatus Omnitrophica bacterium]|nr:NYN domain-containing protein [Candidatus Omnitrophota bacterium]
MFLNKVDRIAVLIDGENSQARHLQSVMESAKRLGDITVKRLYADFTTPATAGWKQACIENDLEIRHQFALVKGKNTIDIEIVMDAMEIMYSRSAEAVCIVSSDSDFRGLTLRLKKSGIKVYGFGNATTVSYFRQACDKFFFLGEKKNIETVIPEIKKLIDSSKPDDSGYIYLPTFGTSLKAALPDFNFKDYGFKTMKAFFESRPEMFEIQVRNAGVFEKHFVRNKPIEKKIVCEEAGYERDIMA